MIIKLPAVAFYAPSDRLAWMALNTNVPDCLNNPSTVRYSMPFLEGCKHIMLYALQADNNEKKLKASKR